MNQHSEAIRAAQTAARGADLRLAPTSLAIRPAVKSKRKKRPKVARAIQGPAAFAVGDEVFAEHRHCKDQAPQRPSQAQLG